MTQYAGADVFPASFDLVDDGDPRDAASVNVGFESLADRTIWLKNRIAGILDTDNTWTGINTFDGNVIVNGTFSANGGSSFAGDINLASGTDIQYVNGSGQLFVKVIPGLPTYSTSSWQADDIEGTTNGKMYVLRNTLNSGLPPLPSVHWDAFEMPECTINSFTVLIDPTVHASLPSALPILKVTFWDAFNNSASFTNFSQTDTSLSAANYSLAHTITCTCNFAFNPNLHKVTVGFDTEGGVNSDIDLVIRHLRVAYTKFKYD